MLLETDVLKFTFWNFNQRIKIAREIWAQFSYFLILKKEVGSDIYLLDASTYFFHQTYVQHTAYFKTERYKKYSIDAAPDLKYFKAY